MHRDNTESQNSFDNRCFGTIHVVKRGDTLYNISRTYGVKVSSVMLANPYVNVYNLQVGDEICVPRLSFDVESMPGQSGEEMAERRNETRTNNGGIGRAINTENNVNNQRAGETGSMPMRGSGSMTGAMPMTGGRTVPETMPMTGNRTVPETAPMTGNRTVPETMPMTGNRTMPETTPMTGNRTMPETMPMTGNRTVPETTPMTGNRTVPETMPMTGNRTVSETMPMTGNRTVPETMPMTGNRTMPETMPMTGNRTVPETMPMTENRTMPEAAPMTENRTMTRTTQNTANTALGESVPRSTRCVLGEMPINVNYEIRGTQPIYETCDDTGKCTVNNANDIYKNVMDMTNQEWFNYNCNSANCSGMDCNIGSEEEFSCPTDTFNTDKFLNRYNNQIIRNQRASSDHFEAMYDGIKDNPQAQSKNVTFSSRQSIHDVITETGMTMDDFNAYMEQLVEKI